MTVEKYKRLLNHLYAAKEYYFEYCYGETYKLNMQDVDELINEIKTIIKEVNDHETNK